MSSNYFQQSIGNFVPQSDQQAFKTAFYSAVAFVFLFAVSVLLISIYYLLFAFFRPMLWAVLCGTVLFPFKKTIASCSESWLLTLKSSNTPLLLGLALIPVRVLDRTAETVWSLISSREVVAFVAGYGVVVVLARQHAFCVLCDLMIKCYGYVDAFVEMGSSKWVTIFAFVYLIAFIGYLYSGGTDLQKTLTRFLSTPVWIVVLCHLASLSGGCLRVVVFSSSAILILLILMRLIGQHADPSDQTDARETVEEVKADPIFETMEESVDQKTEKSSASQNKYIQIVLGGCCLIWITNSPAIMSIFVFVFLYAILKNLGHYFGLWYFIRDLTLKTVNYADSKSSKMMDILIPSSIRKFVKLIYYGDQHLIDTFISSTGVLSSIIVMIGLLFILLFMAVFVVFQVQGEVTHLVHLSGNVLNKTLSSNPQYSDWLSNATQNLGDSDDIDSMVDKAYKHTRTWLGAQARLLAKPEDQAKADQLEAQVKMLVDRLYEMYVSKSVSSAPPIHETKEENPHSALDIWSHVKLTTDVSLLGNELVSLIKENVGMLLSVLDTVWSVLRANVQFVFSLMAAIASVLFGLGLEVLNFVIGILVFLTMIYYLLASSKDEWKPIEFLKMLSPQSQGSGGFSFSTALEQAVSSVFILSFKMSTFYGLYAYFLHSLFSLNVVFIPSIFAATFAAIPFLAPYWVFLPGALELYLIRGETAAALIFVLFSFLPIMFVDAAFYKEVKGSHPYMTGLAVVGGIYWLGLEGALIGPIILCCMLVTLNIYRSVLPNSTTE